MKSVAVSCLCRMFPRRICCQSSTGACSTSWCCVGMVTWRGLGVGGFLEVSTAQGFPVRFWTHCGHQLHWSSQSRTPVQLCLLRKREFVNFYWTSVDNSKWECREISWNFSFPMNPSGFLNNSKDSFAVIFEFSVHKKFRLCDVT